MQTPTLTERYISAALRTVPEEQRADIAAELRASIADQIDARTNEGVAPDRAERDALTDLGDPDVLAAGYTERQLWLVGPRYYLDWLRLLKLLLWIVLPCAGLGVAVANTISGATFGEVIGASVAVVLQAALHVVFWSTLVFVVLERTGHETMTAGPWTPDRLPTVRQSGAGLGEMVTAIMFLLFGAAAVLWDHTIGFAPAHRGLSFLAPDLWPGWITALFALLALQAIVYIAVYARRRWTVRLAVANGLLNLAVAAPVLWLLSQGRLLNTDFWPTVASGTDTGEVGNVVNVLVAFGVVVIAVWDTIDVARKAR